MTSAGSNPLIVHSNDADKGWSGTGPVADIFSLCKSVNEDAGAVAIGVNAVSTGLSLLGTVMAPLNSLAAAGFGWLIEHVWFLEDALEVLTGDPDAIEAQAKTWRNIAGQVRAASQQYDGAVGSITATWRGIGASGYATAGEAFAHALRSSAVGSESAATAIEGAGALVGIERGMIRDLISEFAGWMIVEAGIALATSWCSFGTSIAVFTTFAVGQALKLASTIADRLSALSRRLDELGNLVSKLNGSTDKLALGIKDLGEKVDTASANLTSKLDNADNLPDAAGKRVNEFFQNTEAKAHQVRDAVARARDGQTTYHENVSHSISDRQILGRSVGEWVDTNALNGQNYVKLHDLENDVWGRPIEQDSSWSAGDNIKVGNAFGKNVNQAFQDNEKASAEESSGDQRQQ